MSTICRLPSRRRRQPGGVYYLPRPVSTAHLTLMRRIDELHLEFPFAGSRRLRDLAPDGAPDPGARSDQQPGLTEGGWLCSSMKTDDPRKPDAPIVAYYGSYTVDEAGKKIFGKIEAESYWARANMETIWTVQGSGDKLTFILSPRKTNTSFSPKSKYGVLHNCKESAIIRAPLYLSGGKGSRRGTKRAAGFGVSGP